MPGGAVKQCVICGDNCAEKPRVKDRKGRYYCKPCYNRAAARKRQQQQERQDPAPQDPGSPGASDSHPAVSPAASGADRGRPAGSDSTAGGLGLGSLLDDSDASGSGVGVNPAIDPADDRADDAASKPAPGSRTGTCPECGHGCEAGAVICVNCGYNLRSGQKLQASVITDDGEGEAGDESSRSATRWPRVIGILAIIVAALGLLSDLAVTVGLIPMLNHLGALGAVALMIYVLGIGFSGWLGVGAVMLLQRRALASMMLRLWAGVYLATYALLFTAAAILAIAASGTLLAELEAEGVDQEVVDVLEGAWTFVVIGWSVFNYLWLALVPVFILLWFRRGEIQREVEAWEASEPD